MTRLPHHHAKPDLRFDVDGKVHFALRYLASGPATVYEIAEAMGATPRKRRVLAFVLGMLRDRGLLVLPRPDETGEPEPYHLTTLGREALATLNAGEPLVLPGYVPSVRIFSDQRSA